MMERMESLNISQQSVQKHWNDDESASMIISVEVFCKDEPSWKSFMKKFHFSLRLIEP